MENYWNHKFINKKYIWGLEGSIAAELVIKDMEKEGLSGVQMADLACGYGRDVNYYRNHGMKAFGIDSAEEAIRIGKEQWKDLDIVCDDIFTYAYEDRNIDVFTCNFIIHLLIEEKQRAELLKIINKNLAEGGIAYFTVSSDQDCDFSSGEVVGENLVKNARGVTKFYYNEQLIQKEFGIFSKIEVTEFREKHYHDYEHEHVNYIIKCKK